MAYKYREVKCPWCDHVFMWRRDEKDHPITSEYRLKENGESVGRAKCPKCNKNMFIIQHILEGVDTKDDRIEPFRYEC